MNPEITIVLPSYNSRPYIKNLAKALREQTLHADLLVVDSSSPDGSANGWREEGASVVSISQEEFNHSATRNYAVGISNAEVIVFITQDTIPASRNWLDSLVRPLIEDGVAKTFARQIPKPGASPIETFFRGYNYPSASYTWDASDISRMGIKAFFTSNACSAVRRDAFQSVGGFPERAILAEDMLLAARLVHAGYRLRYVAEAEVFHSHNHNLSQKIRRSFDHGVAFRQHREEWQGVMPGGEGYRYALALVKHLLKSKQARYVPVAVLETLARYIAFQLGLKHEYLPRPLVTSMSMHKGYWYVP